MEGLPEWGISSMPRPPPRQHKHGRRYTLFTHPFILTRRLWKHDSDGQMMFGDLVGIKFSDLTRTWRASRMRVQLNAGVTSETTQTWKTIHTIHAPIHSNKANIKGWLCRPNNILGPCGPIASWHLSYRRGKTPKKTSPRERVPTGDRTPTRCVTDEHATACSTAVDPINIYSLIILIFFERVIYSCFDCEVLSRLSSIGEYE